MCVTVNALRCAWIKVDIAYQLHASHNAAHAALPVIQVFMTHPCQLQAMNRPVVIYTYRMSFTRPASQTA